MGIAKVTRGYQVTIPKDVRTLQDIHIGDTVLFAIEGNRIDFMKMKKEILNTALGSWKDEIKEESVSYVKKLRGEWDERAGRVQLY